MKGANEILDEPPEGPVRPPCDACGKPSAHAYCFWSKSLCSECWPSWKAHMDNEFDTKGKCDDAGALFTGWFQQRSQSEAA